MSNRYYMTLSLNVLNHMGLNLYSNTPAVLAEVIANSWDADATDVQVDFDVDAKTITISDNGCGMDLSDVNAKFLYVGYQKRPPRHLPGDELRTPKGRKPMGRKGIGKLSLFSIANKIHVYTRKEGNDPESFLMDASAIREVIENEDPSVAGRYEPENIPFDDRIRPGRGTTIRITELKKVRLTQASVSGLRRRLARRFSIIGDAMDFRVSINGQEVTLADRDYFHTLLSH